MLDDIFKKLFPPSGPAVSGPVEYIVAGLGNPGGQYADTRHNAGYLALDVLAEKYGVKVSRIKFKSLCGECQVAGKRTLLLKPSTYMNLSGQAVQEAMAFHKVPIERVIVICDDVALQPGAIRIRQKGSDGGHNGLKNIIYLTGKDSFSRVRIGIGNKAHPGMDMADWVIGRFTKEEAEILRPVLARAAEAAELIIDGKIGEAMNRFNQKPNDGSSETGNGNPNL